MDGIISYKEYKKTIQQFTEDSPCPVKKTLEIFSKKWAADVIFELSKEETMRFGELRKALGNITSAMLTTVLKDLEEKDVIIRKQYNEIPLRVEYELTEGGKNLYPIFIAMANWGMTYCKKRN